MKNIKGAAIDGKIHIVENSGHASLDKPLLGDKHAEDLGFISWNIEGRDPFVEQKRRKFSWGCFGRLFNRKKKVKESFFVNKIKSQSKEHPEIEIENYPMTMIIQGSAVFKI